MALLCLLLDAVCCGQPCSSDHREKLSSVLAGNSYSLGLEKGAWISQDSSPSVHPSQKVAPWLVALLDFPPTEVTWSSG